jgi:hypothetical protein
MSLSVGITLHPHRRYPFQSPQPRSLHPGSLSLLPAASHIAS